MKRWILLVVLLGGCTDVPSEVLWIQSGGDVEGCKRLGLLSAEVAEEANFCEVGMTMLEEAEAMGATHLLVSPQATGLVAKNRLNGTAYKCDLIEPIHF